MNGYFSGFEFVTMRSREDGQPGTNIIFRPNPEHQAVIPGLEILSGESVMGIKDFDFQCRMVVSYIPSLLSFEGMVPLYDRRKIHRKRCASGHGNMDGSGNGMGEVSM